MAICFRYSNSREEAEEVLQEVFMKIFSKIEQYNHEGSFEGWMKKVCVRQAIDSFRKNRKINEINSSTEDIDSHYDLALDVSDVHDAEELLYMISSLPDGYRMIFNLYEVEGYKHNEIAEMLNISEGTSKSQLSRAKKMIQEKLVKKKEFDQWKKVKKIA